MANLEVLTSIAGSRPEKTTLNEGETFTQHEAKLLFVPLYTRRIVNHHGKALVSERYLGVFGHGQNVPINPGYASEVSTPFNSLAFEDVRVQRQKPQPRTFRYV